MKLPKKNRRQTLSIIAAMDEKGGIGKKDRIPWHIKKDLIRLRDLTKDCYVILGRTSYESMAGYYDKSGRPMPAKEYVVLTSNKAFKSSRKKTHTSNSVKDVLDYIQKSGQHEVFVIGGQTIFEQFMKYVDKLYLTIVKGKYDCDTFFPDYSDFKKVISSEEDSDEGHSFIYKILERE